MSIIQTYPHQADAIAKLLAGTCPDCGQAMPPVPLADIEECLDDTGGELGHMCDDCFVGLMAGSGWDLSFFERFTPQYANTPEKQAFIRLLDECNDKCREQQWLWHNRKQSQAECYAKQAAIRAEYAPRLENNPFKLLPAA